MMARGPGQTLRCLAPVVSEDYMPRGRPKLISPDETVAQKRERWAAAKRKERHEEAALKVGSRSAFDYWRRRLNDLAKTNPDELQKLLALEEEIQDVVYAVEQVLIDDPEFPYAQTWRMLKAACEKYGTIEKYPIESAVSGMRQRDVTKGNFYAGVQSYDEWSKQFPDKSFIEYGVKTRIEAGLITQLRDKILQVVVNNPQAVDQDVLIETAASFISGFTGPCHNNFEAFWLMLSGIPKGRLCLSVFGVEPHRPEDAVASGSIQDYRNIKLEDQDSLFQGVQGRYLIDEESRQTRYREQLSRAKRQWGVANQCVTK